MLLLTWAVRWISNRFPEILQNATSLAAGGYFFANVHANMLERRKCPELASCDERGNDYFWMVNWLFL